MKPAYRTATPAVLTPSPIPAAGIGGGVAAGIAAHPPPFSPVPAGGSSAGNGGNQKSGMDEVRQLVRTLANQFGDGVHLHKEPAHWTAALGEPITRQYCPPFIDPTNYVPCETFHPAATTAEGVLE